MSKFKRELVLTRDVAEKQVELLMEFYDIDPDYLPEAFATSFETERLTLVKGVTRGRLSIEEKGDSIKVVQILAKPVMGKERIEYQELDSLAQKVARNAEAGEDVIYKVLAVMCKMDSDIFDEMDREDRKIARRLGSLFLTV